MRRDCAEGGFAVALAECCIESGGIGARVDLPAPSGPDGGFGVVGALFGEAPSRIIVSAPRAERAGLLALARDLDVPASVIGRTGGGRVTVSVAGEVAADAALAEAEHAWASGLARHFEPGAVQASAP